jgi:hypothetical protein
VLLSSWFIQQHGPEPFLWSPAPPVVKDNGLYLVGEEHRYAFRDIPYILCLNGFLLTFVIGVGELTASSVISGFRRDVDAICALLGCYGASSGNPLPMFRTVYGSHL